IHPVKPYDFGRSLEVARVMSPDAPGKPTLRVAVRVNGDPVLLVVREAGDGLSVEVPGGVDEREAGRIARWILFAGLGSSPFYRKVEDHPVLGPGTRRFEGVKPMRPASLFEMLVVAITEQQLTMAAAVSIRKHLHERFGDPVDDGMFAFPTP